MREEILYTLKVAIINYQNERFKIEALFTGLRDSGASLIKSLIMLADPLTGVVCGISYNELAKLIMKYSAFGRKDSDIPTKQSIRNYATSTIKLF